MEHSLYAIYTYYEWICQQDIVDGSTFIYDAVMHGFQTLPNDALLTEMSYQYVTAEYSCFVETLRLFHRHQMDYFYHSLAPIWQERLLRLSKDVALLYQAPQA